jgi:hypothetical protein
MIEVAISSNRLPADTNPKERPDLTAVKNALRQCFGKTKFLTLVFAIDLDKVLDFLSTPLGEALTRHLMESKWSTILSQARTNWSEQQKQLFEYRSYFEEDE